MSMQAHRKNLDHWANTTTKITPKVTAHLTYMDPDEMFMRMASIPRMDLKGSDPILHMGDKNAPFGLSGEVRRKYASNTASSAGLKKVRSIFVSALYGF